MAVNGEKGAEMDLHRCQFQGYLKAIRAALYNLEEDTSLFGGFPKTHIRIGDLIAQVDRVMGECDTEFLEQVR